MRQGVRRRGIRGQLPGLRRGTNAIRFGRRDRDRLSGSGEEMKRVPMQKKVLEEKREKRRARVRDMLERSGRLRKTLIRGKAEYEQRKELKQLAE